jgi:hypothetical protein
MAAQSATKVGAGDTARKDDDTPESRPIRKCCMCPTTGPVYAWWEHGNAAVCSRDCDARKREKERTTPHYWQEENRPHAKPQLRAVT